MILKPTKKGLVKKKLVMQEPQKDTTKKQRKSNKNTLPPDVYKPMFEPMRILVRETFSTKNPLVKVKQYIEISAKRFGEDDENAPMVYIQMYQESEFYTGYLKGKSVYFPIESLEEFLETMGVFNEECEKRNI